MNATSCWVAAFEVRFLKNSLLKIVTAKNLMLSSVFYEIKVLFSALKIVFCPIFAILSASNVILGVI